MKTVLLAFACILLYSVYMDVHALRAKFAPAVAVQEQSNDSREAHPQPAHKPE